GRQRMNSDFFAHQVVNGLIEGMVIDLPALALTLVMGISTFPNVAVADSMPAGAYAAFGLQAASQTVFAFTALGAIAACMVLSLATYQWVFRKLSKAPMVVNLLASVGLAFMMRSALLLWVDSQPKTYAFPLVRAWNFQGVRLLPTDLWIMLTAGAALLVVFALFRS